MTAWLSHSNWDQLLSDGTAHKTTESVMEYTFCTTISDITITFSRGRTNKQKPVLGSLCNVLAFPHQTLRIGDVAELFQGNL